METEELRMQYSGGLVLTLIEAVCPDRQRGEEAS